MEQDLQGRIEQGVSELKKLIPKNVFIDDKILFGYVSGKSVLDVAEELGRLELEVSVRKYYKLLRVISFGNGITIYDKKDVQ